jgi:hypothetical protein
LLYGIKDVNLLLSLNANTHNDCICMASSRIYTP